MVATAALPAASELADAAAADPYARYRLIGSVAAAAVILLALAEFYRNAHSPGDRDFLAPWAAAQLALQGRPWAAYDPATLHAVQAAAATFTTSAAQLPFPYPPAYLLLVIPFALLSFPLALGGWAACTFTFYMLAAQRFDPRAGWLAAAFPAVFANAAIGQNGFLTAGLFMAGLSLLGRAPLAAGAVLGCLVVKPQLALLVPVALVAGQNWRAMAGATVSAATILFIGVVAFGLATTAAWVAEAPLIVRVTGDGLMGWSKLASVYASARQAGFDPLVAMTAHALVAAAAAGIVWSVWRSRADGAGKFAVLAAGSMLMSPYLFLYDSLLLVPAFLFVAARERRIAVVALIWCIPLLMIGQMGGLAQLPNLTPLAAIALLALSWRHAKHGPALTSRQPCRVRDSTRLAD